MTTPSKQTKLSKYASPHPVLGPSDTIGESDAYIVNDVFSHISSTTFSTLKNETYWQTMSHAGGSVPRLVCVQGSISPSDGSIPVYRHPSDQSLPLLPFSAMVGQIRAKVGEIVGHDMNHVLIQLYRGGEDFISEHSDKTLDIVRDSSIVNVSLGAQRVMRLRTKKSATVVSGPGGWNSVGTTVTSLRKTQLVPMPHGSVFVLGLKTNEAWLHGINADKRLPVERTEDEKAFGGQRISLTFRRIGTFLSADERYIWGQGACCKTKEGAGEVVNGNEERSKDVINAFGWENQMPVFDWEKSYGGGFDVLHFGKQMEHGRTPLLFLSGEENVDREVKTMLDRAGIDVIVSGVKDGSAGNDYRPAVCFQDIDIHRTQVVGMGNIERYIRDKTKEPETNERPST